MLIFVILKLSILINFKIKTKKEIQKNHEACVLHSLITHNDFLSKYDWNLKDLVGIKLTMEQLKHLNELTNYDEICLAYLNENIYSSKTTNKIDQLHVKKLINQILFEKKYDINQFIENSHKFYSKVGKTIESK